MNYLAHLLLAGPHDDDRLGGILGDFVKGPLPGALSASVAQGVALHRSIDSFADQHPAFQRSRERVSRHRRRYAGIMVDMFYDHLLAAHWSDFSDQSLASYAQAAYALLAANQHHLPERLAGILPYMRGDDWLSSYAQLENVGHALDRMARYRLKQPGNLPGAIVELENDYLGFRHDFLEFMDAATRYTSQLREKRIES